MATIQVNDLPAAGSSLLLDDESFLNELSEPQINLLRGGFSPFMSAFIASAALSYVIGRDHR